MTNLIEFLISFLGHEFGFLQLVLEGVHSLFIDDGTVLQQFSGTWELKI